MQRSRTQHQTFDFAIWPICLTLAGLLFGPGPGLAQELNPLSGDPRAERAGAALFRAQCATCHGADARGIDGIDAPDLTRLWSQDGRDDSSVFQIIRGGVPGSIMPAHANPDTEIWMLVSYLRSVDSQPVRENYDGDPRRGSALFDSQCRECHRVAGAGGSLGPDLTRITRLRNRQALVASVRDPAASVTPGYRPVFLVSPEGEQIEGVIKAEDAFSIQIMDREQNLRGFARQDLSRIEKRDDSLMPAFDRALLGDADLEDLFGFLAAAADDAFQRGAGQ